MAEGMVCQQMSSLGNVAGNLGTLRYESSDQEERRLDLMPGEKFQQTSGVWVVRTIVVSQRQFSGIGKAVQGRSEELRSRPIGVVSEICGPAESGKRCGSSDFQNHLAILGREEANTKGTKAKEEVTK